MKSMLASQRRSIGRLGCFTQLTSRSFELQGELQRHLVLVRALVVGIAEADLDEAQIDAGALGFFESCHVPYLAWFVLSGT